MSAALQFQTHWSDKDVEAHWDRVANVYVKENERVKEAHDQRFRESIAHLKLTDEDVVLNVTSRDCEANDYIKAQNSVCMVINAEISSGLMKVAQKIRPWVEQVKIATYSKLPFEDAAVSKVLTLETLEHVSDPVAFMNELYRVSIPEAILVLSCPPATSEIPYRVYTRLFGGHGEGPHKFLSSKRVKQLLEMTGWKLLSHKGTVLIPVGPSWLQRFGEKLIGRYQGTFLAELGIRQFFVCEKY
jgi:ubiquinone/menaquinone biosynthesis C-methylase UbiE